MHKRYTHETVLYVTCTFLSIILISSIVSSSVWRSSDEKSLQQSKIPTMHFQPSLPRLPIPKLPDSCRRYLTALKPILTDEEYSATERIVNEFSREGSDGWGKFDEMGGAIVIEWVGIVGGASMI